MTAGVQETSPGVAVVAMFKRTKVFQFAYDTAILAAGLSEDSTVKKLEVAALQLVRYFSK